VWYVRILNGPDFLALSADARSVLWPLKLRLPPFGIAPFPGAAGVLADDTGLPHERVVAALDELQATGWIEREQNVLWLVRGLEFEPYLNPRDRNHRKYLEAVIAALPTSLTIVSKFQEHYGPMWWPDQHLGEPPEGLLLDPSEGPPEGPNGGPPEPLNIKHETVTKHERASRRGHAKSPTEGPPETPHPAPRGADATALVVGSNGGKVGRTVGYEAAVERGRLALAHAVELARAEARADVLREQLVALGFAYWAIVCKHPNAMQDPKRSSTLRARLRENRNNISEILFAADGCRKDASAMGENKHNRKFNGIEHIYGDRATVERYAEAGGYKPDESGEYPVHRQVRAMMTDAESEAH